MASLLVRSPLIYRRTSGCYFLRMFSTNSGAGPVKLGYPFSMLTPTIDGEKSLRFPDPIWSPTVEFMSWWKFHAIRLFINPLVNRTNFLQGCDQVFRRMNEAIGSENVTECEDMCSEDLRTNLQAIFTANASKSTLQPSLRVLELNAWVFDVALITKTLDSQLTEIWAHVDVMFEYKGQIVYRDRKTSAPVNDESEIPHTRTSMYRLEGCLKDVAQKHDLQWIVTAIL